MIKAQVCRSRGYSFRFIGQDSVSEILADKKNYRSEIHVDIYQGQRNPSR